MGGDAGRREGGGVVSGQLIVQVILVALVAVPVVLIIIGQYFFPQRKRVVTAMVLGLVFLAFWLPGTIAEFASRRWIEARCKKGALTIVDPVQWAKFQERVKPIIPLYESRLREETDKAEKLLLPQVITEGYKSEELDVVRKWPLDRVWDRHTNLYLKNKLIIKHERIELLMLNFEMPEVLHICYNSAADRFAVKIINMVHEKAVPWYKQPDVVEEGDD